MESGSSEPTPVLPEPPLDAHPHTHRRQMCASFYCNQCQRDCIPANSQSWCFCNHRYSAHDPQNGFRCTAPRCPCKQFYFHVTSGSWQVRCQCKHKNIEHDVAPPHKCKKPACAGKCQGFQSPWCCNCDHPWTDHQTMFAERDVVSLAERFDINPEGVAPRSTEPTVPRQ
ncbi:hypothetical protein PAPYR_7072 [Paratrimastix pyriformis]|uniref:Protein FAM221A n=1 Tax=Paratrimastix pyriformis TaxID=342808 RepID=A0ABQ8UGD3_9EUKA|nr:hypothetical protein PAPYR_7072 [Paratrimastix pyriformis]